MPHIPDAVVVITGASSGIGRATAHEFARQGATLMLTARNDEALQDVARECEALGARALAQAADVTDELAMESLARGALDAFGRLDVWVNNAAVAAYGRFDDVPADAFRRVIDVTLMGVVNGTRAALPFLRAQNHGVVINVASVAGLSGNGWASSYGAAKAAVIALGTSLREELVDTRVRVCTVMPAAIDTPFFQHAANFSGHAVQPLSPTYRAGQVAKAIVRCARRPRAEVIVGAAMKPLHFLPPAARPFLERLFARQLESGHFQQDVSAAPTTGNLYQPMRELTGVSGGWPTLRTHPWVRLLAGGVALALAEGARRRVARRLPVRRFIRAPGMLAQAFA